jgi:uncharacterized protein DUF3467
MLIRCEKCFSNYDDENRWTICPHGPLWAAPDAYCRKHDLINCVVCKGNKVDEKFKQEQVVDVAKETDFRDNYANSVQISVSLWDFYLSFGAIKHNVNKEVYISNFQGIFISPQQAKALANILVENVKQYENTFGQIKLSPKDNQTQ